jgi:hypothetical protein
MKRAIGILVLASSSLVAATSARADAFKLTSPDFKPNANVPDKNSANTFGCTGANVSPALEWKSPPAGTKSFALMVFDPDAPTGSGFWHWIVYNIPPETTSLPAGAGSGDASALPKGAVQGNTDMGKPGYVGPCPPPGSGKHHYNFTLFALKVDKLEVPPGATAAYVGFNVNMNVLGKAKLTGLYARKKE